MKKVMLLVTWCLATVFNCQADKLAVNDVVLYYELHGSGKPLLLIHGGSGSVDSLRDLIAPLAKSHKVIAIDLREHGYSTPSDKPLSYKLESEDVIQLIRKLNLGVVDFVGHSDGGIIGLYIAMNQPDMIDRLAVVGANYHFDGLPVSVREYISGLNGENMSETAKQNYLKHSQSMDGFSEFVDELKNLWLTSPEWTEKDLERIKAKTLVVLGDRDFITLEHTVNMYRAIEDAQLAVIPGSEHSIHKMNLPLLEATLVDFFK
ncbi:alpha/beta hydrolase [Porticoccus sp. W117]|uniref:alpha/beta fold hydrolase n=1 Tax=Porticoccus sp. W117 TaxID=3054777 RepID=UPI0025973543|nr:alpha/beta hydrolase [Porticoccus sp. W117]MDM3870960.1 alpha/beta hydrolase [Porticoccus sp. W117]